MDTLIRMSKVGGFHDFLFEVSNEIRYEILASLRDTSKRITDISREMDLKTPETRRHVSRLSDVGLIQRNIEGFYHITPYGEGMLILLQEFDFMTRHVDYFLSHKLTTIPTASLKQIGELGKSTMIENAMDFLLQTENLFKEAKEYVWLLVDQFPLNSLSSIIEAIERGVQFRIIEPADRALNPEMGSMTLEVNQSLRRARNSPLVEQRLLKEINVSLYISEERCVVTFPSLDGQLDYKGFSSTDENSIKWNKKLFQNYWEKGRQLAFISSEDAKKRERGPTKLVEKQIVVNGRNDPCIDPQAIQDAVDNYEEVILQGSFNTGVTSIIIRKSVVIQGEGREENIPSTKLYKSGWTYPILDLPIRGHNRVFFVDGEGIDVTIENIHFTDFDYNCIGARNGNSLTIKNNLITISSGLRRGMSSPVGNQVIGIYQTGGFHGGVRIEGNYLDFAQSYGPIERSLRINALADDPNYRPGLTETYSHIAFGIDIFYARGEVLIENNIIRNINARGIVIADNTESANIQIKDNTIISEIYGSYFGPKSFAGYGIAANSGWHIGPAPHIEILDNTIRCDKINYCGIGVHGPELGPKGAQALTEAKVNNNRIHLEDGSIGIYIESCENSQINGNTLTGKAYYGIGIIPGVDENRTEFGSFENIIENNDMRDLKIKDPDKYTKILFDEKNYPGSKAGSATAYVWLNINTKANRLIVSSNETVLDEGINNTITQQ
jgi:predicted transcriptional regulator